MHPEWDSREELTDRERLLGRLHRSDGITLVEMLVAIVLLGVIFSAAAAALINSSRASLINERRVQSTAFLSALNEEFQAIPWPRAAMYEDELDDPATLAGIASFDTPLDISGGEFEGRQIMTLPGPTGVRLSFVPSPFADSVSDGVREYTVFQVITEHESLPDVRRYTTVARWQVAGRWVEQRFDAQRAPTPSELEEQFRDGILQFLIGPRQIELDGDGTFAEDNLGGISIAVRFDRGFNATGQVYVELPVETPSLVPDPDPDAEEGALIPVWSSEIIPIGLIGDVMDVGALFSGFWLDLETSGSVQVQGAWRPDQSVVEDLSWPVTLVADEGLSGQRLEAVIDLDLVDEGERSQLPAPTPVTVSDTTIEVGVDPDLIDADVLCSDLAVQTLVDGAVGPEGGVTAYFSGVTAQSRTLGTEVILVDGTPAPFSTVFAEFSSSQWVPEQPGDVVVERFVVVAFDDAGRSTRLVRPAATVTFRRVAGECP